MEGIMLTPTKTGFGSLLQPHSTPTTNSSMSGGGRGTGGTGTVGGGAGGAGSSGSGFLGISGITGMSLGSRSSSASSAERSLLLGALATHMGVLDARENDAQTIIRKSELWDEITRQFNAQTLAPRSRQQIQTLYKNMKAKARRYEARLAEVANGVPPPDPDPISEMLLGLLHQQMQHQRRHLQRLAVMDNYGQSLTPPSHNPASDGAMKPIASHIDTSLLTPDQVMQVSLEEGLATDMEVKDEPQDQTLDASPECHPQKVDEEEDEEEETEEETTGEGVEDAEDSTLDLFTDSVFSHSRPLPGVSASASQLQGVSPAGAPLSDQQQQQQDGAAQRLLSSFTSTAQGFVVPASRVSGSGVLGNTDHRTPSPKVPHYAPFQPSPAAHIPPHGHPTRAPLLTSSEGDPMSMATKRPRLDGLGDVGRLKGCGSGPNTRPYNSYCCCPDLHVILASQAEQEHHLRMKALKEESESKTKEHSARMKILSLEEELLRTRLRVLKSQGAQADEGETGGDSGGNVGDADG